MNQFVHDWAFENDSGCLTNLLPAASQKKPMGLDDELVELLWRNGHVVMHSQTHRRSPGSDGEVKQTNKADQAQKYEQPLGSSIQEAEAASWFQFPLDDPFEKDFCSEFFPEIDTAGSEKLGQDRCLRFGSSDDGSVSAAYAPRSHENPMPPPKSHFMGSAQSSRLDSVGASSKVATSAAAESSMMTVGSSNCGSNQIQAQTDPSNNLSNDAGSAPVGLKKGTGMRFLSDWLQSRAHEPAVASSSGGSGCSYRRTTGKQSATKRKSGDAEDSARCQSEEAEYAEYESIEEKKPAERPTSKRRSRAAEVHNLSERRRRDRINEKMKALQDLIPHCNKTDKASMLDEAIEYLKSLQLQLQMMWMGRGMASMMFPGVQQYVSDVGMGMRHASVSRIHGGVQLRTVPFAPQSAAASASPASPASSTENFPSQIQNAHLPESYARYLSMHMMPPHQASNFCTYGSHLAQQTQSPMASSSIVSHINQTLEATTPIDGDSVKSLLVTPK